MASSLRAHDFVLPLEKFYYAVFYVASRLHAATAALETNRSDLGHILVTLFLRLSRFPSPQQPGSSTGPFLLKADSLRDEELVASLRDEELVAQATSSAA